MVRHVPVVRELSDKTRTQDLWACSARSWLTTCSYDYDVMMVKPERGPDNSRLISWRAGESVLLRKACAAFRRTVVVFTINGVPDEKRRDCSVALKSQWHLVKG